MNRIIELDALRGLAAMAVVLSHILMVLPQIGGGAQRQSVLLDVISLPPFRAMWGGVEAVVFFFVLSGFVLSLPFYKGPVRTSTFLLKRIVRIYPAYIVAVALSILVYYWLSPLSATGYSNWFNAIWPESIPVRDLLGHVFLIGSFDNDALNPVLWTLVMEMRIALIFPLIMWVIIKLDWRYCLVVAMVVYLLGRALHWYSNTVAGYENDLFLTLMFVYQFVVGALLAKHLTGIRRLLSSVGTIGLWVLFLLGISLLQYSAFFTTDLQAPVQRALGQFPTTLGVVILIAMACTNGKMGVILRAPVLQFLGAISYSLYLIHGIVLVALVHFLHEIVTYWVIAPVAIMLSVFVAWLLYISVEKPTMAISSNKLSTRKPLAVR